MMVEVSIGLQRRRYQYLAYCVVRDAIGFYFGIPKFLSSSDIDTTFETLYKSKIKALERKKQRELTKDEQLKCRLSIDKQIAKRRQELTEDLKHCEMVLFTNNIWLELLDLNPEFFLTYLNKLSEEIKSDLAVVPRWSTRDHALSRPYINDEFQASNIWQT